ncbi:uroporphyrinogen-III synthase [Rodentibacter trehalosifermentans]|uniref:Uroporphyrinogen-III synthase n=1 Tax=Rodentibacter trehalosifermentans TaxID=1908263 RepID=A0A1V3IV14_9PAST|nr:uroporphyrinogen-III synthase [Rodentibacter trehalosifermentans]OOF43366.1 uroporphyrinogen-III synthase [Rodentibacter trehalosifermentans]OOF46101.1 uroporphyrinogen-III synthase [Rodentibacter trehalosifermentans]OOF52266.1 uroporphyrinogen-III synthase [Rodentibacter trehalosifermentans]
MAVLVTRPDERGKQLVDLLNQSGIVALHLPLFTFESGYDLENLPKKLNQLNRGDYVFLVSKSAVDFSVKTLKETGFYWREDLQYFTVGQRTAQYFSCQSGQVVRYPISQENSEALLALPQMQQLNGKQVLILRGNGGREYFAEQAKQRGANIDILECYRREPILYNKEEQTGFFKRAGVDTLIVTSLEILQTLIEFVPENEQHWLKHCHLVTVGSRLANAAKQLGWQNITQSHYADNQNLLKTLLS